LAYSIISKNRFFFTHIERAIFINIFLVPTSEDMKITIIALAYSTINMGMRTLSNFLKLQGHDVQLIFLNVKTEHVNDKLLRKTLEVCRDSDIIGFSVMTMQYEKSVQVSEYLRKHLQGKVFVWGGIHATLCPDECIAHADIVCIGDGEEFMLDLLSAIENHQDISHIEGSWSRQGETIVQNPIRPVCEDINKFPPPDFDYHNKWIVMHDELVPVSLEMQKHEFKNDFLKFKDGKSSYCYITQISRGCPHRCTYCSNALFLNIFKGKGKILRRKSSDIFIKELKDVLEMYPFINAFDFYDDTFFAATDEEIITFAEQYKKEIGLPFFCLASPTTLNEVKLKALMGAGMGHIQMGVQSGSERVNKEIFHRFVPNSLTIQKMKLLNKYKNKLTPSYDFIVDNPYETTNDMLETVRFMYKIPKPYKVQLFSLVFYPKTELYERALREGILKDEMTGYHKSLSKQANMNSMNFYGFIVGYAPFIPKPIFWFFTIKPVFVVFNSKVFNKFFEFIARTGVKANQKLHFSKNVINK
jgi:anaerobic magnesium-protoporphyrin IX monomethyl ester cyclase